MHSEETQSEAKKLALYERIALHRRMAEAYRDAYLRQDVQEGASYDAWKFADDALYSSPYFTGEMVLTLKQVAMSVSKSATMEAKAYSLKFPDWKPGSFQYWASDEGFVTKTRWEGHTVEGVKMGFYSYGFINTNEKGEITRWETHVNEEYSAFLDVAIGVHGPFQGTDYTDALERVLEQAGLTI